MRPAHVIGYNNYFTTVVENIQMQVNATAQQQQLRDQSEINLMHDVNSDAGMCASASDASCSSSS